MANEIIATQSNEALDALAEKIEMAVGKGFGPTNLSNMRKFFLLYPIFQTVSEKLGWSHICELYLPNKEELQAIVNETLNK